MMNAMHGTRGFTLVETLVAITVILTALVGPLFAVQQALNASRNARDVLVASSLAQEGIEYVRSVRDSNYLYLLANPGSGRTWLHGLSGAGGSTNCITADCVVDPTQNTVSRSVGPLYISASGLYTQQTSDTQTPYTRRVRLAPVSGSATEMVVTVTVSWSNRGIPYTMTVTDRLHDWL